MADKIDKFLEDFQQNMSLLTSDTILILVSYKPDKRTKAFKWFSEQLQLKDLLESSWLDFRLGNLRWICFCSRCETICIA